MGVMIELEDPSPTPPKPALPGVVVVRPTPDDVLDAAAADFLIQAQNCVRAFGDFHLAVSLTGTEPLLRRLMYDPALRELPWKRTHLWMVDEWDVPGDDPRRLFPLLQELLVEPSDIPLDQVHPIRVAADGEDDESEAASRPDERYEADLRECLGWREKGHDRLDCVLLGGIGDQSGPAEIATPHDALPAAVGSGSNARLVRTVPARTVAAGAGADLVTMTSTMLRGARLVSVVALGAEQRTMVEQAAQRAAGKNAGGAGKIIAADAGREFPRSGLLPLAGELRWYLDAEACPTTNAGRPARE